MALKSFKMPLNCYDLHASPVKITPQKGGQEAKESSLLLAVCLTSWQDAQLFCLILALKGPSLIEKHPCEPSEIYIEASWAY